MARAPKDAIVFCLDVSPQMSVASPDADSPLDSSLKIIKMMLQRKIFASSKDEIALILFGCNETSNKLDYSNVSVFQPLSSPGFDVLERLDEIKSGSDQGDFMDAVIVALDLLHSETEGKKIACSRVVLFTDFSNAFSDDGLDTVLKSLCKEGEEVQLNVIAPKFSHRPQDNHAEYGSDGEGPSLKRNRLDNSKKDTLVQKPKTTQQKQGEDLINSMLESGVDGCIYSYDEAVLAVTGFEKRSVRPAGWKCDLCISRDISIPCVAYAKTKEAKLNKTWMKSLSRTKKPEDITTQKFHHLQDDNQTEVAPEDVIKGRKYGKDVIPFSKDDEKMFKYQTDGKCLKILGFTHRRNVSDNNFMDDQSHIVIPDGGDSVSAGALSAFVTALDNLTMCAIARYVYRKGSNPKLVVLFPRVKGDYCCLVMIALPYAEDLRPLEFPSIKAKNKQELSAEQLSSLDSFIDKMSLCHGDEELFRPKDMLNPNFQRKFQCLNHRIAQPSAPLPPSDPWIERILAPDEFLLEGTREVAGKLRDFFKLEAIEIKLPKSTGATQWKGMVQSADKDPTASIKSEEIISVDQATGNLVTVVGSVSPVRDFLTMLTKTNLDPLATERIFEQLQQRIFEMILDPFALGIYKKVIPCLTAMREEASKRGLANCYNNFLIKLKPQLLKNPSRSRYWDQMVSENVTLVESDTVTSENVVAFTSAAEYKNDIQEAEHNADEQNADDLLDEL